MGDGGLAAFGAELEARATPEARARIRELNELGTTSKEHEAVERGDLPGRLSGFTGPAEVVAGECGPLPRQAAESTAAVFPHARLTFVPGAGHQVWYEARGCLAAALSRVAARLA